MSLWALLPAAGSGRRFGSEIPKQFLDLAGRLVLEHSLNRLLAHEQIAGAVLCLGRRWMRQPVRVDYHKPVLRTEGGAERAESVLAGLRALPPDCDWVLVHDAARPCLPAEDLERLLRARAEYAQGVILAAPVRDTMKSTGPGGRIRRTVERKHLWHALTPQLFPRQPLIRALEQGLSRGVEITDEASAMEQAGYNPGVVCGSHRNIKITHPDDLALARFFLEQG